MSKANIIEKILTKSKTSLEVVFLELAKTITELDEKTSQEVASIKEQLIQEVAQLKEVVSAVEAQKGDQGERGEKGDKGDTGDKGDKGDTGVDGKDGIDGIDGVGRDGKDGKDGKDGADGLDGKDGSPDTAQQIVQKINTLFGQLDPNTIKGWKVFEDKLQRALIPTLSPGFTHLSAVESRLQRQIDERQLAITFSPTPPENPYLNQLWIDTS